MPNPSKSPGNEQPRDAEYWARPVSRLKVSNVSSEAVNINVEGRQVVSPLQGFGSMWQKTYSVRLSGVDITSVEVIKAWKENFFRPMAGRQSLLRAFDGNCPWRGCCT